MRKRPAEPKYRRPKVTTLSLGIPSDTDRLFIVSKPDQLIVEVGERAMERIGPTGYALLRSQAFSATYGLHEAVVALAAGVTELSRKLGEQFHRTNEALLERELRRLIGYAHWQAVVQLGIAVENLCALLHARDAARGRDVGEAFLDHDLDLINMLNAKRVQRTFNWLDWFAAPMHLELVRPFSPTATRRHSLRKLSLGPS